MSASNPSTSHPGGVTTNTIGGTSGGGGPCGACRFLRRKCVAGCIFAPYFNSEQGAAHFAAVHKVFGASNVSKLLIQIPMHKRLDAVVTICYEAQARLRDPDHGCVAHLFALQQQVANLQAELSYFQAHLATLEVPTPPPPPPPPPQHPSPPVGFSIDDLPITSCPPAIYDLSLLFDPMVQYSSARAMQPSDQQQFGGGTTGTQPQHGGGDLNELAMELLQRKSTGCSDISTVPPHNR